MGDPWRGGGYASPPKRSTNRLVDQVLSYSEATMPGDIGHLASIGMGEGKSIWERMAIIMRARSLDLRILMDAHDRRNYGFVDVPTFRRSLCYAFGNQWIELAMTSAELDEVCAPYLTRKPNARGEPAAFVMWQKFTNDMQALCETRKPTPDFLTRLAAVEAEEKLNQTCIQRYGVSTFELTSAVQAIKERLLTCNKHLIGAFKRVRTSPVTRALLCPSAPSPSVPPFVPHRCMISSAAPH